MRKSWTFTQTSDLTGDKLGSHGKMDLDTTWQCHVCLKFCDPGIAPLNGDLKWKIWEATLQTLKFTRFMRMQLSKEQDFFVGTWGTLNSNR